MLALIQAAYHAFIAMRQQHNNAALSNPLSLSAADELIKDTLGCVGKVSKLRLPNHQRIRIAY